MRHHGGAENADGDVKHAGVGNDLRRRHETLRDPEQSRMGNDEFPRKASADHEDERDDQRLDVTETFVLEKQDDENIEPGNADAREKRKAEEQIQRDGRADDLRQIASRDGQFTNHP